jgi:hypothetical protein
MRNNKKRSLIALLTAVMLLSGTIGLTAAYFSDIDPYIGDAKLTLKGKTIIHENPEEKIKDIQIENVGEVPVFVRVKLFGPADLLKITVDNKTWIKSEEDGYYYYCKILQAKPDEPYITPKGTLVGTVEVTPKQAAELGDSFTVTAVQECSTIIYDDNNVAQPKLGWTLPSGVARQ